MPRLLDGSGEKWLYAPGEDLGEGIPVDGGELMCIRQLTESAKEAYLMCINNNKIPATLLDCVTEGGEQHQVCQVGSFAIDHRFDDPVKLEDLPYTWTS